MTDDELQRICDATDLIEVSDAPQLFALCEVTAAALDAIGDHDGAALLRKKTNRVRMWGEHAESN